MQNNASKKLARYAKALQSGQCAAAPKRKSTGWPPRLDPESYSIVKDLSPRPATGTGLSQASGSSKEPSRTKREEPLGGADRDRTDDLRLAKPALSQLSYSPWRFRRRWWACVDLNHGPSAYQADALTS